jgi:hypothetical protein
VSEVSGSGKNTQINAKITNGDGGGDDHPGK